MIRNSILSRPQTTFDSWLSILRQEKVIAVIRSPRFDLGISMAEAASKGGIKLIEITWNSDQPQNLIAELRVRIPDCLIGAGTILNGNQLEEAIACGAEFIFSPHFDTKLLAKTMRHRIPYIPGVLSPTEIVTAWQAGASALKVFPIKAMGGEEYIRSLKAPLNEIPLIPTGGVTLENAAQMISAGAIAVGLSGSLFPKAVIENQDWAKITTQSRQLKNKINLLQEATS